MKNNIYQEGFISKMNHPRRPFLLSFQWVLIVLISLSGLQPALYAQETEYSNPDWRFGVAGGANFNFYGGSTQQLSESFRSPVAFENGSGVGLFAGPLVEYYRENTRLGFMLQIGYDSKKGEFEQQLLSPCNCPADLQTDLVYISVEPSLRFSPFRSNFYLFAGPRFAFNLNNIYRYEQGPDPSLPVQEASDKHNDDLSNTNNTVISMQVGAGYDIPLTSVNNPAKIMLSPFVSYHPTFGQNPRSVETWNVSTVRAGLALKLGMGEAKPVPQKVIVPIIPEVKFSVIAPQNFSTERNVRETFPLLNYVFFNSGSTDIPDRYVLLEKDGVKDFKYDREEGFEPLNATGRSGRQMAAYYNVLNILGDRMQKDNTSSVTLIGNSEVSVQDGQAMAASVKQYLVDVFGIDASRIASEGRNNPKVKSEQPRGDSDLALLREEDRRVTIESDSPTLLMEFKNGSDVRLKPIEFRSLQNTPFDSYVWFDVDQGTNAFSSWNLEVTDANGQLQSYGPYSNREVSMPARLILRDKTEGQYKVTLVGHTPNGMKIRKDTTINLKMYKMTSNEEGSRFSILYEFDESQAMDMYEKYLTDIVAPKIPAGGSVRIHGYTDIVGEEEYNRQLSLDRAKNAKKIIENSLMKAGRKDVKIYAFGFGELESLSQFDNQLPEERFYNRSVIIDIYPKYNSETK